MTRRTLLPLFALYLLTSCASPDAGKCPVDLDELAPLIADLQLADALTTEVPVNVRDSMREVYFDNVLAQYGSDRRSFDSLTWIVRTEPAWVDELYTKVGVLLAKEEVEN
jgi:predicted metal-dependent HD superfamily phosphohydrolase